MYPSPIIKHYRHTSLPQWMSIMGHIPNKTDKQGGERRRRFLSSSSLTRASSGDMLSGGGGMDLLHRIARQAPTPVSLQNLYHFGKSSAIDPKQRLRNAQFLHNELQIRIAGRVVELEKLPLDMCQTKGVKEVVATFARFFELVNGTPYPEDDRGEENFTAVLKEVLQDHNQIIETMARGALEVKSRRDFDHASQRTVDSVLSRFYMARIGLRFLIEHHIQSRTHKEGFAGIIQSQCSPIECVEQAANDAAMICTHHLGEAPDVQVLQVKRDGVRLIGPSSNHTNNITFTYVPGHIVYMLTEVLKNSCRATVEEHAKRGGKLPPIRVVVVEGANDVTIRISDEGGGIRRKDMDMVWSYLHTTAKSPPELGQDVGSGGSNVPALAGYGVGLPLSRLYARYFGGDLAIKSLEGFGTDVYCHLSRLGQNCENLPEGVLASPSERDSTILRGMSSTNISRSGSNNDNNNLS